MTNEMVPVFCFDDYYIGEYWNDTDPGKASEFHLRYTFMIPKAQRDRWERIMGEYLEMQEEIHELLRYGTPVKKQAVLSPGLPW